MDISILTDLYMIKTIILGFLVIFFSINNVFAGCDADACDTCCAQKGGIRYSDSTGGRYVCNDGDYSVCYSTIHAVMDMQKFEGCCMWEGGVLKTTPEGIVLCRDGSYSEICSMRNMSNK